MKKYLGSAILLTFILIACANKSNPIPTPTVDGIEYCPTAEIHLKSLGCIPKDGPYTLKGKSFTQFCEDTMKNGINLHPNCLSQIISCNQMNACVQQN